MSAGLRRAAPLLAAPRYEVLPAASTEQTVLEWVPKSITLTVTASPVRGLEPTLALAERLAGHGYTVVPHLSARLVRDAVELAEIVARLRAAGIEDVFVPGGDADPPAGCFDSALSLLRELAELGRPFRRVGIAGYPQSHPKIADDITVQAMWDKRHHAAYLVSNLCFDPVVLARWIARVRARGVTLPLQVGLAGPVDRTRLLRMAAVAGVRESARFASGHTDWLLRLGTPGGYRPDRLLGRAGAALAAPAAGVEGLHIFTFNQLRQTEQWRQALLARWPAEAGTPAGDELRPAAGGRRAADGRATAGGGAASDGPAAGDGQAAGEDGGAAAGDGPAASDGRAAGDGGGQAADADDGRTAADGARSATG